MHHWFGKKKAVFYFPILFVLLSSIACGSQAEPVVVEREVVKEVPVVKEVVKEVPVVKEVIKEVPKEVVVEKEVEIQVVVIATPAPAVAPAAMVSPGKVTAMAGSFGSGRFDYAYSGTGSMYSTLVQAVPISRDVKEGGVELAPGIATEWGVSSDGLTWTLTLRKGVKFHDGTDVTAEDVVWSLSHTMAPGAVDYLTDGLSMSHSRIMDRIEQTGPDQISITTTTPAPHMAITLSELSPAWIGSIAPKRATLHDVEDEAAYDLKPIGAGPMRLATHVPGYSMAFERFADYYYQPKNGLPSDRRVNFEELDLLLVPEEATRVAALRANEADFAPVSLALRSQIEAGGGRLVFVPEGLYSWIYWQGCADLKFPCHDKRVRQALGYAIDKELMQDRLYGGDEVMVLKGWIYATPSSVGYTPDLDPFPFDPDKARELLADAGYPGGEGFGKLIVNTWVSQAFPLLPESAQVAADFWNKELGLDVEVKVGDEANIRKLRQTDALYGQITWRENEASIDGLASVIGDTNRPLDKNRYKNHDRAELYELNAQAASVFDPVEREKAVNNLYRTLREEAYDMSVGYVNIPWGVGPDVLTWEPYPVTDYLSAPHTITLK